MTNGTSVFAVPLGKRRGAGMREYGSVVSHAIKTPVEDVMSAIRR